MIMDVFVTKLGMTQVWTVDGKRLAVTRCALIDNNVIAKHEVSVVDQKTDSRSQLKSTIVEVGFGSKKTKQMKKPLLSKIQKSGFSFGVKHIKGVRVNSEDTEAIEVGSVVDPTAIFSVGDVVSIQGRSKGKGFAGGMKRWNFSGGPKTHGQSDRARAVGSIGAGTTPGRVWLGKKMPGNMGRKLKTVNGLVVLYIDRDTKELWLSGPVPGTVTGFLRVRKTGQSKEVQLDYAASNIAAPEKKEQVATEENTQEESEK